MLDLLAEIARTKLPHGYSENLVALGMKSAELAAPSISPKPTSPGDFLEGFATVYSNRFRNTPPEEGYWPEKQGEGHYLVTNNTPFPHDAIYGLFWHFTKYFCPPDHLFIVRSLPLNANKLLVLEIKWGRSPAALR